MARYDLSDEELIHYRSSVVAPEDLAPFWDRTLGEARSLAWAPKVEPIETGLRAVETFDVTFSGFGGEPVKAWLHTPVAARASVPIVVHYAGYGCGRGLPHHVGLWPLAGYASLFVDNRGQGALWGYSGDTPDPEGSAPSYPGYLTRGILDPDTYYYRRLFTDAVLAVDAARSLPNLEVAQVAVEGNSQGGGIALAVSGLADNLAAAIVDVPFLCDFPRAAELAVKGPYLELAGFLASYREHFDRTFASLAYFDAVVLAQRATAPALFSVALMDQVCPPSTVYAAYNAYSGPKEIRRYPFNDHEGGQFHQEAEELQWLPRIMAPM